MKSKTAQFVILIVAIIIVVIGLGIGAQKVQGPGKYDAFAKALKDGGATFYGAFWCSHCQAQKQVFGASKQYLPYVECSNPDQSQTPICIEKKIESFPTWIFRDGITVTSTGTPTICEIKKETPAPTEAPICAQVGSEYFKTWIFPDYKFSFRSATDPVQTDTTWKFAADSMTTGELPLEFLASQIGYTLPE